MQNLIEFILKYRYWFVFFIMEIVSLYILCSFNSYQGSVFFTTANSMVGDMYSTIDGVSSYVNLGKVNKQLEADNEQLRAQIHEMNREMAARHVDTLKFEGKSRYHFLGCEVINATLHKSNNLLTLNKGKRDGIKPEMGVVCSSGVVGVVYLTSDRYSIVMPLLNVKSKVSCRIHGTNLFGAMEWEQGNPSCSYFTGIPTHVKVRKGALVETNGYSDIFPADIPIGKVVDVKPAADGLTNTLTVELSTDFSSLRNVSVITNYTHAEKRNLEQYADSLQTGE